MGEKKLVIACLLALVIVYACIQGIPEVVQEESLSVPPSGSIFVFSETQFDPEPCGGGGGDDVGGGGPL